MRPLTLDGCVQTELSDGELVVSTPDGVTGIILNAIGGAVLELCDGTRTVDDIVVFLCSQFSGTEPKTVSDDVRALLSRLLEAGIVEDVNSCGLEPSGP